MFKMINVLIVEDQTDKLKRITQVVQDALGGSCNITTHSNYVDACQALEDRHFHFLILDLLIPRTSEKEEPVEEYGLNILRSIGNSGSRFITPNFVVGLTAFSGRIGEFDAEFSKLGWRIFEFDISSQDWSDSLTRQLEHANEVSTTNPIGSIEEVVLILHGIRDFGSWQTRVKKQLESSRKIKAFTVKYGRFGLLRFVFPKVLFDFSAAPLQKVRREIENIKSAYPTAELSVIAHSFGTHLLMRLLKSDPHILVKRILLCGSVVDSDFKWESVRLQIGDNSDSAKEKFILNDCGNADKWPLLAKAIGYGAIGTNGAGSVLVTDRFHLGKHSLFFDVEFMKKFWIPFFESGEIVPSEVESRSDLHWSTVPFDLAPAWLIALAVVLTLGLSYAYCLIGFWILLALIVGWAILVLIK